MNVFQVRQSKVLRWIQKDSIDPALIELWRLEVEKAQLDLGCSRLSGHVKKEELRRILLDHQLLIQAFEQALQVESPIYDWPHLLLVTDKRGGVLAMGGSPEVLENSKRIGICAGTRFDLQHAGLNAISMAIKLRQPTFVRGEEHDLRLFKDWSCLCTPISVDGETLGYLDVSFPYKGSDPGTEVTLVELYLNVLKEGLAKKCPRRHRNALYKQFKEYGLSPREKEIAYYWALNQGGLQIAELLGITESTVRSVIKKIYQKTGVSDKGQFIRMFLA